MRLTVPLVEIRAVRSALPLSTGGTKEPSGRKNISRTKAHCSWKEVKLRYHQNGKSSSVFEDAPCKFFLYSSMGVLIYFSSL